MDQVFFQGLQIAVDITDGVIDLMAIPAASWPMAENFSDCSNWAWTFCKSLWVFCSSLSVSARRWCVPSPFGQGSCLIHPTGGCFQPGHLAPRAMNKRTSHDNNNKMNTVINETWKDFPCCFPPPTPHPSVL